MRVLKARTKRPLDLLAVGARGHVAAASSAFGARGEVNVWEVATGRAIPPREQPEQTAVSLTFSPDGIRLVVGEGQEAIAVFEASTRAVYSRQPAAGSQPELAFSADGRGLLATTSDEYAGEIVCYAPVGDGFDVLWTQGPSQYSLYSDPAFSPGGTRVAVSVHDGYNSVVRNAVQVRDAATGKLLTESAFPASEPVEQIAFSADSRTLLARSSGRVVKLFDAASGAAAGELLHPRRPYVTGMAVHPSGVVACSRTDGTVCFWALGKRELVRTLDWKLGTLVSVAFSPDGSIGAAGTEDGQVVVWDADV